MKKLIGIGIAAMMVMGLVSAAGAATIATDWLVSMKLVPVTNTANGGITLGTLGTWTDSPFSTNATTGGDAYQSQGSGARLFITTDLAPIAPATLIAKDGRSALSDTVQSKTWNLTIGGMDGAGEQDVVIAGWVYANKNIASGVSVQLLGLGNFIATEANPLATDVKFANDTTTSTMRGSSTNPLWTRTVHYDGVHNINLQLVASVDQVVPEPGSILALASGLVGLVGFGIRRRK